MRKVLNNGGEERNVAGGSLWWTKEKTAEDKQIKVRNLFHALTMVLLPAVQLFGFPTRWVKTRMQTVRFRGTEGFLHARQAYNPGGASGHHIPIPQHRTEVYMHTHNGERPPPGDTYPPSAIRHRQPPCATAPRIVFGRTSCKSATNNGDHDDGRRHRAIYDHHQLSFGSFIYSNASAEETDLSRFFAEVVLM